MRPINCIMDPLSVFSASAGLAVVGLNVSTAIYTCLDDVRSVDDKLKYLHGEVEALNAGLNSTESIFRRKSTSCVMKWFTPLIDLSSPAKYRNNISETVIASCVVRWLGNKLYSRLNHTVCGVTYLARIVCSRCKVP